MKLVLYSLLAAVFLKGGVLVPTIPVSSESLASDSSISEAVRRIHKNVLTIDPHIDIPIDFGKPGSVGQFDLAKLDAGDLDVATVALFANTAKKIPANIATARREIDTKLAAIRQFVNQHPDRLEFATTANDLERIPSQAKHAILLSYLNAYALGTNLTQLPQLYKEGVRMLGLAHAGNNDWVDSSRPVPGFGDKPDELGGLSTLGKQAVVELNRLGGDRCIAINAVGCFSDDKIEQSPRAGVAFGCAWTGGRNAKSYQRRTESHCG